MKKIIFCIFSLFTIGSFAQYTSDLPIDAFLDVYNNLISNNSNRIQNIEKEFKELKSYFEAYKITNNDLVVSNSKNIENLEGNLNSLEKLLEARDDIIAGYSTSLEKHKNEIDTLYTNLEKHKNLLNTSLANIEKLEASLINKKDIAQIENKTKNLEHGVAMITAMSSVDFSNLADGDLEISAGLGTYAGKVALAFGVAYAPIESFNFNTKVGVNFAEKNKWAASAGARYRINLKK